jgi:hypothetical protein
MSELYFDELSNGYKRITDGSDEMIVYEHQVVALLDNPPEEVFDDDHIIHHRDGAKLDNRPGNLTTLDYSDHAHLHANGVWEPGDGDNEDIPELKHPVYEDVTQYGNAGD